MTYLKFQVEGVGQVIAPDTHVSTEYQTHPDSPWHVCYKADALPAAWPGLDGEPVELHAHIARDDKWYFVVDEAVT